MTQTDFDALFAGLRTYFSEAGFALEPMGPLAYRATKSDEFRIEFGGERYSDSLQIAISGSFSHGEWLVFPFIAEAIERPAAERIRGANSSREAILAALTFISKNADQIHRHPETYLDQYGQLLEQSGIPRLC